MSTKEAVLLELMRSDSVSGERLAEMLGVSLPTLRQLTHRADFPAVKLGRRYIIPLAGLQRWLDAQTAGTERGMQS